MAGDEVFFSTGTDEHGAKIEEKAREAGLEPLAFADGVSARFRESWDRLDVKYDRFIRTTEGDHVAAVQNALKAMYISGEIYLGTYEGLYCKGCEQYKSEKDLVDGKCSDHQTVPENVKEESYMFRMSKYQQVILDRVMSDEFMIRPLERKNEVVSFLQKEKLKDVSFSRKNVSWGIPVPWDETHTIYVWADAFLNYLTALGWNGEGKPESAMWPADVQLMSKDILRVHATIWPAMLLALGLDLPKELFVHGYFLIDGQKMSKSLGNVIAPEELVEKFGADAARYLLLGSTVFGHDGDIGWQRLKDKYNADLANGIGNLAGRVLSLTEKYLDAAVPAKSLDAIIHDEGGREQIKFKDVADWSWETYGSAMKDLELDKCLDVAMKLVSMCDRHISATALWKLVRENKEEGAKQLYSLLEILRHFALMIKPFMPGIADGIEKRLGIDSAGVYAGTPLAQLSEWGGLEPGLPISKGEGLFPRVE
jgi:methionyl-tRNA synthetase